MNVTLISITFNFYFLSLLYVYRTIYSCSCFLHFFLNKKMYILAYEIKNCSVYNIILSHQWKLITNAKKESFCTSLFYTFLYITHVPILFALEKACFLLLYKCTHTVKTFFYIYENTPKMDWFFWKTYKIV